MVFIRQSKQICDTIPHKILSWKTKYPPTSPSTTSAGVPTHDASWRAHPDKDATQCSTELRLHHAEPRSERESRGWVHHLRVGGADPGCRDSLLGLTSLLLTIVIFRKEHLGCAYHFLMMSDRWTALKLVFSYNSHPTITKSSQRSNSIFYRFPTGIHELLDISVFKEPCS